MAPSGCICTRRWRYARGVPLGLLLLQFEAPAGKREKDKPRRKRKTQHWVRGLCHCAAMAEQLEGVREVSVMDREADFFELFDVRRRLGTVELLVRAKHNQRLRKRVPKLCDGPRAAPEQARRKLRVLPGAQRRGTKWQKASKLRPARLADMVLRWRRLRLPAPRKRVSKGLPALDLSVVHVREEGASEGMQAPEWILLTSLQVSGQRDAGRVLEWCRLRWRIED